jgi:hypothetical protein
LLTEADHRYLLDNCEPGTVFASRIKTAANQSAPTVGGKP